MVAKLLNGFFSLLLKLIMTLVQIICLPINALFENVFPDFSDKITLIENGLNSAYSGLSFAVSIIPPMVRETIAFIISIEIAMLVVMKSTHMTNKVWSLLQKIKFW